MDIDILLSGGMFVFCAYKYLKTRRRKRRFKVREINHNRRIKGFYATSFLPMKTRDPQQFFKYTRMTPATFEKFYKLMEPKLRKQLILPDAVSTEERLAVTLHFLSQGSSIQTTAWMFQLGLTTVHEIIKECCLAIWETVAPIYLKPPTTVKEWKHIANDFYEQWNFPNCLGALDGKHISIQAPAGSGSLYFNYKKFFSIVLLACADASYHFTLIDVGAYGAQSDGGVFRESLFGHAFDNNELNIPPPSHLRGTHTQMPYVLVADEAFPLKHYIMRPYPGKQLELRQRIFNYRLSRARRVIENAFGILVARWRILRTTIIANVENIDNIVKAAVCLHNFVKQENGTVYCPKGYVDSADGSNGLWRTEIAALPSVGRLSANNAPQMVYRLRDTLSHYFLTCEGELPWQYERV